MKLTLILGLACYIFLYYAASLKGQDLVFIYNNITFKPQETFSPIEKSDTLNKNKSAKCDTK